MSEKENRRKSVGEDVRWEKAFLSRELSGKNSLEAVDCPRRLRPVTAPAASAYLSPVVPVVMIVPVFMSGWKVSGLRLMNPAGSS